MVQSRARCLKPPTPDELIEKGRGGAPAPVSLPQQSGQIGGVGSAKAPDGATPVPVHVPNPYADAEAFAAKFMAALKADFDRPAAHVDPELTPELVGIEGVTEGQVAISKLRHSKPDQYVKICAGLLPKESVVHADGALGAFLNRLEQARRQREQELDAITPPYIAGVARKEVQKKAARDNPMQARDPKTGRLLTYVQRRKLQIAEEERLAAEDHFTEGSEMVQEEEADE